LKKIGNLQTMREINKSHLLNLLYVHSPISRVDLARKSKLSPSTVTVLVEEIMNEGLIYESGIEGSASGVGRKRIMLSIREDKVYVLGIDMSSSSKCVLLNLKGEIVSSKMLKPITSKDMIREALIEVIDSLITQENITMDSIKWMGVAVPGRVHGEQGLVSSSYFEVENMPMQQIIHDTFGIPVHLVNDLQAASFAELFRGAGKGKKTILYILIGHGVGASFVIDNQIYSGTTGRAGVMKHLYHCGTNELAEMLRLMYADKFQKLSDEEVVDLFVELGMSGQEPYAALLQEILHMIAKYCANVVLLFNPDQLVLSGWIMSNSAFFAKLVELIHKYEEDKTPIVASQYKAIGAAVGAATLGLHQMFKMKTIE